MSDDNAPATAFARILRGVLRPLVRTLIAHGLTAPALYRILKRVYVEVAEDTFGIDGARPTDSRVTLLTGVHRRDVREIREEGRAPDGDAAAKASLTARVVGLWLAGEDTVAADGTPLALPRSGPAPSFEALLAQISRDIRPRTVLDELIRQGLATEDGDRIAIVPAPFAGSRDQEQKAHFFVANVGDHIAAAADNLLADDPRFFERAVFYNQLRPESVDALEAEARRLGQEALHALNRMAHRLQEEDSGTTDAVERFRYGVFFYRTEEDRDA